MDAVGGKAVKSRQGIGGSKRTIGVEAQHHVIGAKAPSDAAQQVEFVIESYASDFDFDAAEAGVKLFADAAEHGAPRPHPHQAVDCDFALAFGVGRWKIERSPTLP